LAGVALVGLAAGPADAAAGAASQKGSCAADLTTEQGACVAPVDRVPLTAGQKQQRADKEKKYVEFRKHEAEYAARYKKSDGITPNYVPPEDNSGGDYKLPEVSNMYIWKEGEGNGKKSYTCGPSATRNMIGAMYQHRDGYYKDYGENTIAGWEGTTTSGTAVGNIAAALNNHVSSFGSWVTHKATDRDDYLSKVAVDTYSYHQSVIVNVDTEKYSFFNDKPLNHFDFTYGWDSTDPDHRFIYVAEEWDPIYIYGSSSYGNPYGKHKEPLINAFQAEDLTSFHKMVV
jgi:hypothetical protein